MVTTRVNANGNGTGIGRDRGTATGGDRNVGRGRGVNAEDVTSGLSSAADTVSVQEMQAELAANRAEM
jgi:hypothetical protein